MYAALEGLLKSLICDVGSPSLWSTRAFGFFSSFVVNSPGSQPLTMSSSPPTTDDVGKSSKMPEEQAVTRVDSSEMATEVIDVDAAYLASSASTKFYRGVLFQMILL